MSRGPLPVRHRERELGGSIRRCSYGVEPPGRTPEPHLSAKFLVSAISGGLDVDPHFPVPLRACITGGYLLGHRGVSVLDAEDVPAAVELAEGDPEVQLRT